MNDFTKEELKLLFGGLQLWMEEILYENEDDRCFRNNLYKKMKSMIDNYREDPWDRRKIAESHLREAESLISHAMCLLDMKEE